MYVYVGCCLVKTFMCHPKFLLYNYMAQNASTGVNS